MSKSPDAAIALADTADRDAPEATLSMRGVVKRWNADRPPVLDGVDLDVAPGTAVLVTGRNGAGKTTLLRIAAGLITPDRAEVTLEGLDSERDRRGYQSRLGYVSAGNTGLYARLRLEHHLEFWARLALVPRDQRAAAMARVVDAFELRELQGQRVDRLSMGQRQRLRIALSFLHEPRLVLMDEPTTSLDSEGVELLNQALDGVRSRGGAAVVCAPTGEHLELSFDRRFVVGEGRLEAA